MVSGDQVSDVGAVHALDQIGKQRVVKNPVYADGLGSKFDLIDIAAGAAGNIGKPKAVEVVINLEAV